MRRVFTFRQGQPFATIAAARASCIRHLVAISVALGYPRDHTEAEVVRVGGGVHVPIAQIVTRWWARYRSLADGAAFVLDVSRPEVASLDGQTLVVPATYLGRAVPGGAGTVTIDLSRGVEALPDDVKDAAEEDGI